MGIEGPLFIDIYYDKIYKTFYFQFVEKTRKFVFKGKLLDKLGKPTKWQEVTATVNGKKFRTFTNSKGEYYFFDEINGPLKLQSGNTTKTVPQIVRGKDINLSLH